MILYKNINKEAIKKRPIRTMDIKLEEKPERPSYAFRNNKDRRKYIDMVKALCRSVPEYKEYIQFLKSHMDMNKCIVLKGLTPGPGKKYSIEMHHDPFTLKEIINIVLTKRQALGESISPYKTAEEVLELHYDGKVGLIPLSVTMHELSEDGNIFIPLYLIYQDYASFYNEYEDYIDDITKSKIELKINMSMNCKGIVSSVLDTEFVYVNVDGFDFPIVPDEWKNLLKIDTDTILPDE